MKMQIAIILKKVANNEVIDAFGIRFFASIMITNEYHGNARFATANGLRCHVVPSAPPAGPTKVSSAKPDVPREGTGFEGNRK